MALDRNTESAQFQTFWQRIHRRPRFLNLSLTAYEFVPVLDKRTVEFASGSFPETVDSETTLRHLTASSRPIKEQDNRTHAHNWLGRN